MAQAMKSDSRARWQEDLIVMEQLIPLDQARRREARGHNMSPTSFNEPGGDKVVRTNGSGMRMAPKRASSQAARPGMKVSVKRLERIGRNLLLAIGVIDYDPGTIETTFAFESFRTDQMVVLVRRFWHN
jgi:hypothetical protein